MLQQVAAEPELIKLLEAKAAVGLSARGAPQ